MKWNLKYFFFVFYLFIALVLFSCLATKKEKTRTITETVIKFDTIVKFIPDTVVKIVSVYFTDTAFIDSPVSTARSYYSNQKQRIVLELQNKKINVPVSIYKKVTNELQTNNKTIEPPAPNRKLIWGIFIGAVIVFLISGRKEIFK